MNRGRNSACITIFIMAQAMMFCRNDGTGMQDDINLDTKDLGAAVDKITKNDTNGEKTKDKAIADDLNKFDLATQDKSTIIIPDFGFPDGMKWKYCHGGGFPMCHDSWGSNFSCCTSHKCPSGWSCSHLDCWNPKTTPCPVGNYCNAGMSWTCSCYKSKGSCSGCYNCSKTCQLYPSCPW